MLKAYHETIDPHSPNIELLSPAGSPHPYYAEMGFVAKPGESPILPGPDTLWQADQDTLTAATPVTLTYDNGHGLIFRRKISVDDRYMFTITDSVENKTGAAVTLYPYALVSRHGKPQTSGYSVLHEGMVGVIGDSGVQEPTYNSIEKEPKATKMLAGPAAGSASPTNIGPRWSFRISTRRSKARFRRVARRRKSIRRIFSTRPA